MFLNPAWLLLAVPIAVVLWSWRLHSRLLQVLRAVVLFLLVVALAFPVLKLPSRVGTVVVVADRSLSMPPDSDLRQKEAIELLQNASGAGDRLAVVAFGRRCAIETSPVSGVFTDFVNEVDADGSNLADSLDTALSLLPSDRPGRILVLSDGYWTGRDPGSIAARAAAGSVSIDYRLMQRTLAGDLAVSSVDAPVSVGPGEYFMITSWLSVPVQGDVRYELKRNGRVIAAGVENMPSGLNRLVFRDRASVSGVHLYTLGASGSNSDPVPENNTAKLLVGIDAPRSILCVSDSGDSNLARLLKDGGLDIRSLSADQCEWSLERLSGCSAVILEEVPAELLGLSGMETLAAWVSQSSSGLMITGGEHSYGPGGYFRSPLDPILPVSMELRREHRKLSLAMAIAMDRSGSMGAPVGLGKTKMDLANLAAVEVLDLLGPMDELSVIAVDSTAHVIVPVSPIGERAGTIRNKILRIESMGGGIFVYNALLEASDQLASAQAGSRHIILFADAADSEQPGKYKELLAHCRNANITVSVIGLGKPTDVDADFLRDVAARGDGRCFFTEDPAQLPRLFAQDTFVVARSTFVDEPTAVRTTGGLVSLAGRRFDEPFSIGGYNLCYLRDGANLAMVTVDEYEAPVVAAWQAGIGRVLCYTGQVDGEHTGDIANWPQLSSFLGSLARWTAGKSDRLGESMLAGQSVENGVCKIRLHLDPERSAEPIVDLPVVTSLQGDPGARPTVRKDTMSWRDADTLEVDVPINGSETSLSTVEVAGVGSVTLVPVCLPYSPEFAPAAPGRGADCLGGLSRATGGIERLDLGGIWSDLPRKVRFVEIRSWLLLLALLIFLVEIAERRTGVLGLGRFRAVFSRPGRAEKSESATRPSKLFGRIRSLKSRKKHRDKPPPVQSRDKEESISPESAEPAASQKAPDIFDALDSAVRRARGRTDKK